MAIQKKQKINWILILQAWAMAWVVIGHAPLSATLDGNEPHYVNMLYHIAYSFHMPLFILVSGYLFHLTRIQKRMPWLKMFLDKLKRLGIPFLVFTFIALVVKSVFSADMERPTTLGLTEYLYAILIPSQGPLNEMWFVAVLFWMFALQPLWQWTMRKPTWQIATVVVLLILYFYPGKLPVYFEFGRALRYGIYFYLGILIHKHIDFKNYGIGYILAALIVIIGVWLITWPYQLRLIQALLGIAISAAIALVLDKILPQIFFTFRNYTYQIFLMGIFIQIVVRMLYSHEIIPNYHLAYFICVLSGLYVPVLICIVAKRLNWRWLNLCLGLG